MRDRLAQSQEVFIEPLPAPESLLLHRVTPGKKPPILVHCCLASNDLQTGISWILRPVPHDNVGPGNGTYIFIEATMFLSSCIRPDIE